MLPCSEVVSFIDVSWPFAYWYRVGVLTAEAVANGGGGAPSPATVTFMMWLQGQAVGMIQETVLNTGAVPREVSADAGYYSAQTVDDLYALGVDPFVAPGRTRHGTVIPPASRGRIPGHLSAGDRMRRKLRTKRGRQRYALRMKTVEPVFGQVKQGRGFRQFLLRGLEKANREWLMICTGHNLLKLFRFGHPAPA